MFARKSHDAFLLLVCIDGLKFSNSLFFEKQYESNCYLFEPHKQYKKLIPSGKNLGLNITMEKILSHPYRILPDTLPHCFH